MTTHLPRTVSTFRVEDFRKHLLLIGAVELPITNSYEVIRYRHALKVNIIYRRDNGTLTYCGSSEAHYREMLGEGRAPRRMKTSRRLESREKLLLRDGTKCFYCRGQMNLTDASSPARVTVEHLVSHSARGGNHMSNLVLAGYACNQLVDDKPLVEKIKLHDNWPYAYCGAPKDDEREMTDEEAQMYLDDEDANPEDYSHDGTGRIGQD